MLSFGQIVAIILVALIVLGPKKTHELVRQLGRWAGRARVYWRNLSEELERETDTAELMRDLRQTRDTLRGEADKFKSTVSDFERNVNEAGKKVGDEFKAAEHAVDGSAPTPQPDAAAHPEDPAQRG
ncbi:MAG: hypothetical protein EPN72_13075 [Nevskiaceae bacterium]|nr:MAG: hypothetical protein EPN63_02800 [Nevskiaceae bacterium]TBR71634.1 MAG: hypothetical protein EPN72_13075 [Nevskiaceae bacterium]